MNRTKPINDNDVNIQGIIKRAFHFEGKLISQNLVQLLKQENQEARQQTSWPNFCLEQQQLWRRECSIFLFYILSKVLQAYTLVAHNILISLIAQFFPPSELN